MTAMLPSLLLMGFNESGCLRGGWHDLERDGRNGVPYRATRNAAELEIGRNPAARTLCVLLSGSPSLLGHPLEGEIQLLTMEGGGGAPISTTPLSLAHDIWVVRSIALPGTPVSAARIRIVAHELVIPDRVLRNGDARALGFYVSAVWCR